MIKWSNNNRIYINETSKSAILYVYFSFNSFQLRSWVIFCFVLFCASCIYTLSYQIFRFVIISYFFFFFCSILVVTIVLVYSIKFYRLITYSCIIIATLKLFSYNIWIHRCWIFLCLNDFPISRYFLLHWFSNDWQLILAVIEILENHNNSIHIQTISHMV